MIQVPNPDVMGKGTLILGVLVLIYWLLGPLWIAFILMAFGWLVLRYIGRI